MVESIVYRDVKPTTIIKRELLEGRSEIEARFRGLISVDWALEVQHGEAVAGCRVHCRSGYYRAQSRSRQMPQSIRETVERLVTQRIRKKEIGRSLRKTAPKKRSVPEAEKEEEEE